MNAERQNVFSRLGRFIHRPVLEVCLLVLVVGGLVHYGATKGINGYGSLMTCLPPTTVLTPSETDVSGLSMPTNFPPVTDLCFWGIQRGSNSVVLGLAWPEEMSFYGNRIDIFGNWDLRNDDWRRLCAVDVSGAASNAVVEIARADFPTNAMDTIAFFRAASREDSDGDGLTDAEERLETHTDPLRRDTDNDGDDDGWEVALGFDPLQEDPGIRPYDFSPHGGDLLYDAEPLQYGFFGFETTFGGPEAGYEGDDWPPANSFDGLPQFAKDRSHAKGTFKVSLSSHGWFRPYVTSNYVFRVAADDNATFSVGGAGASVTWDEDKGSTNSFIVPLVAGVCYPVSVDWDTVGGPYFLTLLGGPGTPPEDGGTYHPQIRADPHLVTFKPARGVDLAGLVATASIVGDCDPEKSYEIVVEAGGGLVASGASAHPVDADGFWSDGRRSTAVFRLLEDGEEISSDCCVFVCQPVKEKRDCGCCREGTTTEDGCILFSQSFGSTPNRGGLPTGRAVVRASRLTASLYTPAALRYDHPMMRRMVYRRNLDAVVVDGLGESTEYRRGLPSGVSSGFGGQLFRDGEGRFTEELPDGLRVIYDEAGNVAALQPQFGDPVAVSDLGIAVTTNSLGVITSIASVSDGTLATSTLGTSWRLAWTSPSNAAVKRFDFGGSPASSTFTLHEYRSERFQFDYRWTYDDSLQDFVFERGVGTAAAIREEKSLAYDPVDKVWNVVHTHKDAHGGVTSSSSSVLDRNGHALQVAERRDAVSGRLLYSADVAADGRVMSETDNLGRRSDFVYDAFGRVTRETVTATGVPTRVVEYGYTADLAPIDRRPASRRTTVGGLAMLEEAFAYGATSTGNRTATRTRTCNGVTRTSYDEYDANARQVLSVGEDGRATRTTYSSPDNDGVVVETEDEGVWQGGFATVPGKSTRAVRFRNSAGDVVRRERHALVGEDWHLLEWSTHAYNASHKETQASYSDGTTSAADWICPGPVWRTDRTGVTVSNEYSAAKLLASSTRYGAFGPATTRYTRDAEGRVVGETRSAAGCETQTTTRTYDSRGRVVSETDVHGATTTHSYRADDLEETVTYANGGTLVTTLNPDGSTASIAGTSVLPEFHAHSVTNLDGAICRVEEIRYGRADSPRFKRVFTNGFGETVREERSGANGSTLVVELEYDGKGNLVGRSETGKPIQEMMYDDFGAMTNLVQSADGEWRASGSQVENIIHDGEVFRRTCTSRYCSDADIAPLTESRLEQLSGRTIVGYIYTLQSDIRGNTNSVLTAIDPARMMRTEMIQKAGVGNVATNVYLDGMLVTNVSHSAVATKTDYDAYRRVVCKTDGRGNATRSVYDSRGFLSATVDPLENRTIYVYSDFGELLAVTNALGNATVYEYDLRGNKVYEGGATYPVRYAYDVYGNKITMTTYRDESLGTGSGDTTRWLYDEASNCMTNKVYADGKGPSYVYDAYCRLTKRTWARGIETFYSYDGWDNLTNTTYSDSTPTITLSYDALGRQAHAVDAAGVTTFAYDVFGSLTNEMVVGVAGTNAIVRLHDSLGRDAGYTLNGVRQSAIGYDAVTGRLATMLAAGSDTPFVWAYLFGSDLKSSLTYPNGLTVSWSYGNRGELFEVDNAFPNGSVSKYVYICDAAGHRVACTKSGSAFETPDTNSYRYNSRSELTNVIAVVDVAYRYGYDFDDIGNRRMSLECGVHNVEYVANNLNQYTEITNISISQFPNSPNFQPVYDEDGNQTLIKTTTGIWSVTYNGENRPVRWERIDQSACRTILSMSYDRMGRRLTKNDQRFVYNGYLQIADNNGNSYIWDCSESVATRPLVWRCDAETSFYTHDGNNNVSEVVVADGSLVAHYDYAPFGAVVTQCGVSAVANPWRFSSEFVEDDTATVCYNYRHYNPMEGRWLSLDPSGDYAFRYVNTPLQFSSSRRGECYNLYSFIGNHLDSVDMLGLEECVCGPDVTQWLVDQMKVNAQHHVIKTMREIVWPRYVPFFNLGWTLGALYDFKELVKAGAVWDFKASQIFKTSDCPKGDMCQRTVTVCGECVDYDVPGNIHYGYIGRAASLRAWFLHNRASAAQAGGVDPPDDVAAIDFGIELWDGTDKNFCSVFNKYKEQLNHGTNDKSKGCSPCKEKYR